MDLTGQFRPIAAAVAAMPAAALVLDAELVALGEDGMPDFLGLHRRRAPDLRLFAFDLLALDGVDVRDRSLMDRKALLRAELTRLGHPCLRMVESFDHGSRLLEVAEQMHLEGIVSKRRGDPYRSGPRCGWVKVKTRTWREANRERWRLFEGGRRRK